jgi:hypothetical protein
VTHMRTGVSKGRRVLAQFAVATILLFLVSLALSAQPAWATRFHPPLGSFCEPTGLGTAPCQPEFGKPEAMAVVPAGLPNAGDLLVIDAAIGTVSRWNPDGTPANFSALGTNVIDGAGTGDETPQHGLSFGSAGEVQIAVDNSGGANDGNIYVPQASAKVVDVFASSGEFLGQLTESSEGAFTEPCGVAVDPSGNLYVGDFSGHIHKYEPAGSPPENGDSSANFAFTSNCTLASGAGPTAGFLFAAKFFGSVEKLDATTGAEEYEVNAGPTTTLSVDPSSGHLFTATGEEIAEFDASGASSATATSSTPLASSGLGVAVNGSTGNVYATRSGETQVEVFGPLQTTPDLTTGAASGITLNAATLNGTVSPDGVELAECAFEYGKTTAYDHTAPCETEFSAYDEAEERCEGTETHLTGAGDIPADESRHCIAAELSELQAGTTYHFRLVAKNVEGNLSAGPDHEFATLGPIISGVAVRFAGSTAATLVASINPNNASTTYHVEYGTDNSYGQSTPESAPIGSDATDHSAAVYLTGLAPDTVYHFRFVATSECEPVAHPGRACVSEGEDRTLTTHPPPPSGLPDGRSYELVTPPSTGGNALGEATSPVDGAFVSADGEHVLYTSLNPFADAASGLNGNYLASRRASGWLTTAASLPPGTPHPSNHDSGELLALSADSSTLLYNRFSPLDPNDRNELLDVYLLHLPDHSTEWMSQNGQIAEPPPEDPREGVCRNCNNWRLGREYGGSSADFSHVLFSVHNERLTPADSARRDGWGLYERSAGTTRLVGVKSDGTLTSPCGAVPGDNGDLAASEFLPPVGAYPISRDGSRIFFESPPPPFNSEVLAVSDPSCSEPVELYLREDATTTTEVSLSQRTGEVGTPAPDGAIFRGATPDGTFVFFTSPDQLTDDAPPVGSGEGDLYRYDVGSGALSFLAPTTGNGHFQLSLLQDRRGDPMISADGSHVYFLGSASATGMGPEGLNLYLWHSGTISYVSPQPQGASGETSDAQISTDGSTLAFTANNLPGAAAGKSQIYLYREPTGSLACISCDPNGIPPTGQASFFGPSPVESAQTSRNLGADGKRLFFDSPDPLLPQATNGLYNVYEWEADGTGSCHSALRSGGCIYLLSDGNSERDSFLVGASSDGRDAVFATVDRLTPQDEDGGSYSFYDARIGGGFPVSHTPAPCSGEACRGASSAPPAGEPLGSAAFTGHGNHRPLQPRCRKGFVRKHRRCVRRHHHTRHHRRANRSRRAAR